MPTGQVKFFGEFKLQIYNPAHQIFFFREVKETLRPVHARYSLPKWQTVKLTFFTPWVPLQIGGNPHHPKMNQIPHKKLCRVIVSHPLVLNLIQGWLYTARLTFWKAKMCEKDLTYHNVRMYNVGFSQWAATYMYNTKSFNIHARANNFFFCDLNFLYSY